MLNLKPHKTAKDSSTGRTKVTGVTPYLALGYAEPYQNNKGHTLYRSRQTVYLQAGKAYGAGGKEIKELPDWVKAEMGKLSEQALLDVGFEAVPGRKRRSGKISEVSSLDDGLLVINQDEL